MNFRIDHIQLAMPKGEEADARAFWGGLLCLAEIEKPAALQGHGGCWFQLDGAELHIGVETPFAPAKKAHPGFVVADLAALRARLSAAGHRLHNDVPVNGRNRIFTEDPFGNRLEFLEFQQAAR